MEEYFWDKFSCEFRSKLPRFASIARLRRARAVEAAGIIGGLYIGELELAGRDFPHPAHKRPVAQWQHHIRGHEYPEYDARIVGETKLERTAGQLNAGQD